MQEISIASRLPSSTNSTSSTIVHRSGIPSGTSGTPFLLTINLSRFRPRDSPRLYTLHPTLYTAARCLPLHPTQVFRHLSCVRRWLAVSSLFPCQSVLIRGRYISRHLLCFCQLSGNILSSFLVLPLAVLCSRPSPRVFPTSHLSPIAYSLKEASYSTASYNLSSFAFYVHYPEQHSGIPRLYTLHFTPYTAPPAPTSKP